MIIVFDTDFEKGDKVQHRAYEDIKFIVTGYLITYVKNEKVTEYLVQCSDGELKYFMQPEEIEKEPVNK